MGIETHEAKLLEAIATQNALLLAMDKKHADFVFLKTRDVLMQQAQCWLSLARLRRLASVSTTTRFTGGRPAASPFGFPQTPVNETVLDGIAESLAHARHIFFNGDADKSQGVKQGQVLVLVEEAEMLLLRGQSTDALLKYDDAIQRCNAQGDPAMESLVHYKREALRLDLDTRAKLDQLTLSPHENISEREILQKCFDHLTSENTDGVLHKEQLAVLARDLGAQTRLTAEETDELWQQIHAHDPRATRTQDSDGIDFPALWRWWMAEEMYDFRNRRTRRHT